MRHLLAFIEKSRLEGEIRRDNTRVLRAGFAPALRDNSLARASDLALCEMRQSTTANSDTDDQRSSRYIDLSLSLSLSLSLARARAFGT